MAKSTTDWGRPSTDIDRDKTQDIHTCMHTSMATTDRPATDTDGDRPTADADRGRTTTDTDRDRPTTDTDRDRPTTDADRDRPTTDTDRERPTTDTDRDRPTTDTDRDRPTTDTDRDRPSTDTDRGRPSTDTDRDRPTTDTDRDRPSTDTDRGRPSTDTDRGRPTTDTDRDRPTTDTDRDRPTTDTNRDRPTIDSDGHKTQVQDRGWAWVVAFAGMVAICLSAGVYRTLGLLLVELMDVYDTTTTEVSLILTCSGIGLCVAALTLIFGLGDIFHERALLVTSALLAALGFVVAYVSTGTQGVYLLGISTGVFMALGDACCSTMAGRYFNKRLALANGIILAGESVGTLALPPFVRWMFEIYTHRGASLIMAGISLNAVVCAVLMRPFDIPIQKDEIGMNKISSKFTETLLAVEKESTTHSTNLTSSNGFSNTGFVNFVNGMSIPQRSLSPTADNSGLHNRETLPKRSLCMLQYESMKAGDPHSPRIRMADSPVVRQRDNLNRDERQCPVSQKEGYLKDNILCYEQQEGISRRIFKSLRISLRNFAVRKPKCRSTQDSVWKSITFSFGFFKSPSFVFFQLFVYFSTVGCECLLQFYPAFAKELGLSDYQSASLLSIVGGADLVGRIVFGFLGDHCVQERYILVMVPQFMLGILCFFEYFGTVFWSQVIFAVLIGLLHGVTFSFQAVLLVDLFGLPTLLRRLGVSDFIAGLAIASGSPVLGSIRDATGDFRVPLQILGSIFFCGGISLLLIGVFRRSQKRRRGNLQSAESLNYAMLPL